MNDHSPDTPRRRWRRFSLRGLFVAATLLCVWLGWQADIVHQRKLQLQWCRENNVTFLAHGDTVRDAMFGTERYSEEDVSWVRSMMGDRFVSYFDIRDIPLEKRRELADLFPEAGQLEKVPTWHLNPIVEPDGTVRDPTWKERGD